MFLLSLKVGFDKKVKAQIERWKQICSIKRFQPLGELLKDLLHIQIETRLLL